MKRVKSQAKRKFIEIDRGLFLVRYSGADDSRRPPTVRISLDPSSDGNGHVILHPDAKIRSFPNPETALAVKASHGRSCSSKSLRPRKTARPWRPFSRSPQPRRDPAAADGQVGHRQAGPHRASCCRSCRRIGDVGQGWRVDGRTDGAVGIEGFAVQWPDMPEGLEFRYAVKAAQANSATGRMTDAGTFAGTRGKALPLVSLVLELSGDDADEHELEVDALFLGARAIHESGQRVMLSGPTGREPTRRIAHRHDIVP